MEPYLMHNNTDLRHLDGRKIYRIAWIVLPHHAFCSAENVVLKTKDENSITLLGNEDFSVWFEKMHSNIILNSEICWIDLEE